jgi:hypothetical protein
MPFAKLSSLFAAVALAQLMKFIYCYVCILLML